MKITMEKYLEIENDLSKWKNLQLSLLGRISTIKMNILPKMYFFIPKYPNKIKDFFFKINGSENLKIYMEL